jgi:hypothetical protein
VAKKRLRRPGSKGPAKGLDESKVRLTQAQVSAIWRATAAGDVSGATFIVRDFKPDLTVVEARRVAVRVSKGANSPGVSIGSDPMIGDYADVSTKA